MTGILLGTYALPTVHVECPLDAKCDTDPQGFVRGWRYTTAENAPVLSPWSFFYVVDGIVADLPLAPGSARGVPTEVRFTHDLLGRVTAFDISRNGTVDLRVTVLDPNLVIHRPALEVDWRADGTIDEHVVIQKQPQRLVTECRIGNRMAWRVQADYDAAGRPIHSTLDQNADGQSEMELFVKRDAAGSMLSTQTVTLQGTHRPRAWFRWDSLRRLTERWRDDDGDGDSEEICRYQPPCPVPFWRCRGKREPQRQPLPTP